MFRVPKLMFGTSVLLPEGSPGAGVHVPGDGAIGTRAWSLNTCNTENTLM